MCMFTSINKLPRHFSRCVVFKINEIQTCLIINFYTIIVPEDVMAAIGKSFLLLWHCHPFVKSFSLSLSTLIILFTEFHL